MKVLIAFLFQVVLLTAFAQEPVLLEGVVTDIETNQPVPYASIGVVGFSFGTSSNADGLFSLRIPEKIASKNYAIKITCIGFESEVIHNPKEQLQVKLKPSKTMLKEVVIFDKTLSPAAIVKKAFSNVKMNYNTKPFLIQGFYRHYCKEDTEYGRLIEAAVDIYKAKGYKVVQPYAGWKDQVRVHQLRRSFDNTRVSQTGHVPIALYQVMSTDVVGFQNKGTTFSVFARDVSALKRNIKNYRFTLDGITDYDGERVYKISYQSKNDSTVLSTGLLMQRKIVGTLYITTDRYAIVSAENQQKTILGDAHQLVRYKKINGKYYPYHAIEGGTTVYSKQNFRHQHHVELITTDVQTKGFTPFRGKQPDKETLLKIDYDSVFWQNYNILKTTPLEDSIVRDLERKQNLDGQFADFVSSERERYFSGKEDEEKFNRFLESNRGVRPVYIDFWASWCGPCIAQMPASKELVEKYKGRIAFVYLSLDDDIEAWKKMVKKLDLEKPFLTNHFRIGSQSDAATVFEIAEIPRYVLIDKQGNFVDTRAKGPGSEQLRKQLDLLLGEN